MDRLIKKYGKKGCFFIAEIGNNHSGEIETAKKIILAAKASGASAVKFQKRKNDKLMQKLMLNQPYENSNSFGKTYFEHREKVELSIDEFKVLKEFCDEHNICFFATPFEKDSLDELESLNCELYKIASADIVHTELLEQVAQTNKAIILSTGGATLAEVDYAVEIMKKYEVDFSILQCTSKYPCEPRQMNLNVIKSFKERYKNIPVGLSDHQSGISMSLISYMLGARIFEKHFTLHRSWKGTDQSFSLEPEGLRKMVRDIITIEDALGDPIKKPLEIEKDAIYKMRKSIVLKRNLNKGHIIKREDLEFLCPGNGLPVNSIDKILEKKTKYKLKAEHIIKLDDLI